MWYAFMEFASTIGTDRQLNEADGIGAASWLAAALLIVWLWASGKSSTWTVSIPFAWWFPSFILASYVVYS